MAPRQSYRAQNRPLRLPSVQFTGLAQQAQSAAQFSADLNRMSNFFLQQTQAQAKIAGEEYGALNAPTRQQIEHAKETGESIDLPGGNMTVFDQAAKQAAYQMTADTLQNMARDEISLKVTAAYQNNSNPFDLANDIDAVIAGFAGTLTQEAPTLARAFRAKMGIYANSKYESYAKYKIGQDKTLMLAKTLGQHTNTDDNGSAAELAKNTPPGVR